MKKYTLLTQSGHNPTLQAKNIKEATAFGRRFCRQFGEKFQSVKLKK